jgi:cell division transport system ATP-binding protein
LEDKLNTSAGKLSRGEQQRVAIARAVANEPLLILADEPTGNLDAETTELVMGLFHRCNKERGTTLLIATHDHSIYNHPGSKVLKIEQGRLVAADGFADKTSGEPVIVDPDLLQEVGI